MGKYKELAQSIVQNVGGKENVKSLYHCVTRLRFNLKDESKANDEAVKATDGVIALVKARGEYMVVIGEHVADVYDDVCEVLGIANDNVGASQEKDTKTSIIDRALKLIMSAMGPTLNLLCAAGIIKGLLVIFAMLGLPTDSGVYMLMYAAGDALFYAMPVFMGFNVAKYLGIDPYFGFLLGAALTYPTIQGVDLTFGSFTVNATYTSTFLPILFGVLISAPIYKFFNNHFPKSLKGFLTPMLTMIIALPLTFIVVGPLANTIGAGIAYAMNFLFDKFPIIAYTLLGGLWQILVMFGVHGVVTMFAFYAVLAGTPSAMLSASLGASYGITGILLGLRMKTKNKDLKDTSTAAAISAFLGVTEPAMYGIIVPRKVLLGISCVCGAVGGLISGLFGMKMYTYAGMGPIGLIGYLNPENPQILPLILIVVVPLVLGFLLSSVLFKDDAETEKKEIKQETAAETKSVNTSKMGTAVYAPVAGTVKDMSESSDDAFATLALGKGAVIEPESNEVVSPIDGTVSAVFPTGHAVGITGENGEEVLIHIGIDTVNLQGKYFTTNVKQGDTVKKGDLLVTFDRNAVKKEGYSTEVMVCITNSNKYLDVISIANNNANAGDEIIRILK